MHCGVERGFTVYTCAQPLPPQLSVVHGLLSSQLPALAMQPTVPLQPSGVHGLPSLQVMTPDELHASTPLTVWQLSPEVHALPSLHGAPGVSGLWAQPWPPQLSVVHALLSSQPAWAVATQVTAPCCMVHRSGPEQGLPSSQ